MKLRIPSPLYANVSPRNFSHQFVQTPRGHHNKQINHSVVLFQEFTFPHYHFLSLVGAFSFSLSSTPLYSPNTYLPLSLSHLYFPALFRISSPIRKPFWDTSRARIPAVVEIIMLISPIYPENFSCGATPEFRARAKLLTACEYIYLYPERLVRVVKSINFED